MILSLIALAVLAAVIFAFVLEPILRARADRVELDSVALEPLADAATGDETLTLRGIRKRVLSLAFSPDGHWLVAECSDGTIRVWDGTPVENVAVGGFPGAGGFCGATCCAISNFAAGSAGSRAISRGLEI